MVKKTSKKKVARFQDAGTAERAIFVTEPEVQRELQEVSRLRLSRQKTTKPKASAATKIAGEDVDAVPDEMGSGEESVGGSVATPDQDIVENLGKAAGI